MRTVNIDPDFKSIAVDVIKLLRQNNLSYTAGIAVLDHARNMLNRAETMELIHLPIADGFEPDFNPDHLILSGKPYDAS